MAKGTKFNMATTMEIVNVDPILAPASMPGADGAIRPSLRPPCDRGRCQSQESNMKSRPRTPFLSTSLALALSVATVAPIVIGPAAALETAVAPEKNPPGDIPDNQVFVQYTSRLGFGIKVPEGWSRAERSDGARFSDKYNIIDLVVSKADQPPNAATATTRQAAQVRTEGRSVEI